MSTNVKNKKLDSKKKSSGTAASALKAQHKPSAISTSDTELTAASTKRTKRNDAKEDGKKEKVKIAEVASESSGDMKQKGKKKEVLKESLDGESGVKNGAQEVVIDVREDKRDSGDRKKKSKKVKADKGEKKASEPVETVGKEVTQKSREKKGKRKSVEGDEEDELPAETRKRVKSSSAKDEASRQSETTSVKASKAQKSTIRLSSPSPQESLENEGEVLEADAEEAEADAAMDSDDESVHLHGFSESENSSDEEDLADGPPIDLGKLPTIDKDDAAIKKRLDRAKRKAVEERGVIYLGRIPHGFYEDQMRGYFSQFGDVTRVRLSRNKKTGASKHYAFIEFANAEVAQIVSETMDNYLLMGHILRCKVIPKDEVHPELWVGANRKYKRVPWDRVARVQHNKARTDEEQRKAEERLIKRQELKKRKLEELGIKYDLDPVTYKRAKAVEA